MWSMQSAGETTSSSRLSDHRPDYGGVNGNIEWRTVPDKHRAALRRGPSLVKIVGDGLPSDGRQWQHVNAVGLSHPDSQRAVLPIDVVQAQRRYLTRAKTEIHQAANDCVVALALRFDLLKSRHQLGEFLPAEVLRQRSQRPARCCGNSRQERLDRIRMPQGAKPQIAPNGAGHNLCTARLVALALRGKEVADCLWPQPREIKTTGRNEVCEEPANPLIEASPISTQSESGADQAMKRSTARMYA